MTRLAALLLAALLLAACASPLAQQPASPLPMPVPRSLPAPIAAVSNVRPRTYVPLVRATRAFAEDECSANQPAAWMLSLIRNATWQGRAEVRCDYRLAQAAQWKADHMAAWVYAGHVTPQGVAPNDNVRAHGYPLPDWYPVGGNNVESFAAGWSFNTAEIVLAAWKASPTHWRHVAATDPFFVGQQCAAVGYAYTPGGGWYHYWTFMSAPCL